MSKNIKHTHTKYVICPYCGDENRDSCDLEIETSPNIYICAECGCEFQAWKTITIEYSTRKNNY